jgi:hypothetical protein
MSSLAISIFALTNASSEVNVSAVVAFSFSQAEKATNTKIGNKNLVIVFIFKNLMFN